MDKLSASLNVEFDHVAVAAPRIRDLLDLYGSVLGGEFVHGGDNPRVGFRAMQLRFQGGSPIELIEPLGGSTFLDGFLRSRPEGGVHHVTFIVEDIFRALEVVETHGLQPVGVHVDSPRWREAFLHPREANGVLVQLAEKDPDLVATSYEGVTLDAVLAGKGFRGNGVPSP